MSDDDIFKLCKIPSLWSLFPKGYNLIINKPCIIAQSLIKNNLVPETRGTGDAAIVSTKMLEELDRYHLWSKMNRRCFGQKDSNPKKKKSVHFPSRCCLTC